MIQTFGVFLTEQTKSKHNRGDVAEAIFAAAIAARFIVQPDQKVKKSDVERPLAKLLFDQKDTTKRKDKDGTTIDQVKLFVSIPKNSYEFIKVRKNWDKVSDIWDSCLDKVNSDLRLQRQAKIFFSNNRENEISVRADGTKDQKGSKIDVFLEIDGKRTKNQVSLKTKGGEQFGQSPANDFADFEKVFRSGFNVEIKSMKDDWEEDLKDFDKSVTYKSRVDSSLANQKRVYKAAVKKLFASATNQINDLSKQGELDLVEALIQFIRKYATKDDWEFVEFVKLDKGKAKTLRFGKSFEKKMKDYDFQAKLRMDGDPTIQIREKKTDKELVQIRLKIESASSTKGGEKSYRIYSRMYFELPPKSILFDL